jgi:hypothetical protein
MNRGLYYFKNIILKNKGKANDSKKLYNFTIIKNRKTNYLTMNKRKITTSFTPLDDNKGNPSILLLCISLFSK